jgi:hypothetical protein
VLEGVYPKGVIKKAPCQRFYKKIEEEKELSSCEL